MSNKQQALWEQAQRFTQQKRWDRAAVGYRALVEHDETFLPAWLELSTAQEMLDQHRDARDSLLRAAAMTRNIPPMAAMAVARRLRRYEEGARMQAYIEQTQLAERVPPEKLVDLAMFASSIGAHAKSLEWVERALKMRPNLPEGLNMLGHLRMFAGEQEAAAAMFERALVLQPAFAPTYSVLSRLSSASRERNHVDMLRRLLAQPGLQARDEVHLGYALHNELHDLGEFDDAWAALQRACRAKRIVQPYDPEATAKTFAKLREQFDAEFVKGEWFDDPLVPFFIIGMHRSGTTLLERVLSGHASVVDAGETYTFTAQLRIAADHYCPGTVDLKIAERARSMDYRAIGKGFLEGMRWRTAGHSFVTEKLNPNFTIAGLIAKALPQAKLLHMRRDPKDTCFSNLRTLFTHEAAYSYDLVQLADYYKAYHDLMGYWREIAPDRIFDIDYEDMVADPAGQATRVAAHCGLEFQSDMLDLGRASGMVATASSSHVRKGILSNRGGAWKPYESHLGPMFERLATHGFV